MTMPEIKFKWDITPQTIFSAMTLLFIVIGGVGYYYTTQERTRAAVEAQQDTIRKLQDIVNELRTAQTASGDRVARFIATLKESQAVVSDRVTRVETKVDLMLPMIQRIEGRQVTGSPF